MSPSLLRFGMVCTPTGLVQWTPAPQVQEGKDHVKRTLVLPTPPPSSAAFRPAMSQSSMVGSHAEANCSPYGGQKTERGESDLGKGTKGRTRIFTCKCAGTHLLNLHHFPQQHHQMGTEPSTLWCHIKQWRCQIKPFCSWQDGGFPCFVQWGSISNLEKNALPHVEYFPVLKNLFKLNKRWTVTLTF